MIPFGVVQSSKPVAAPSCTITLEAPGAFGSAIGAQSLDVSGQTLSKTLGSTSSDIFSGGTPSGGEITIDWSGRRVIEFGDNDSQDFGAIDRAIVKSDFSSFLSWVWNEQGSQEWSIEYGGAVQSAVAGNANDVVALVVDGESGDVEFWKNGTLQDTDTSTFSSGDQIVITKLANTNNASLPAGASTTTTVRTAGGDMEYSYNGANDWCGNAI